MNTSCRLDMSGTGEIDSTIAFSESMCSAEEVDSVLRRFQSHEKAKRVCNTSELSSDSKMAARSSTTTINIGIAIDESDILPSLDDDSCSAFDPDPSSMSFDSSQVDRKSVRFRDVQLREYELCLGDNPSVSRGAPLSLDWDIKTDLKYSLDSFEKSEHCAANLHLMENRSPLKRSSLERLHVLKNLGYSRQEIKNATCEAERIKTQRFKTRRRVERNEKIRSFLRSISCFFWFSNDPVDADDVIGDSFRTISTRNSTIDWSTIGTDATQARFHEKRNIIRSWGGRRKQQLKKEWQKFQNYWDDQEWDGNWKRKSRDSLDIARHKKIHSFDLSEESGKQDTSMVVVGKNVCA